MNAKSTSQRPRRLSLRKTLILFFGALSINFFFKPGILRRQAGLTAYLDIPAMRKFSYPDGNDLFNSFEGPVRRLPRYGSSEWHDFNESFMASISRPVRTSVGLHWHEYRNLCISDRDEFKCRPEDLDKMQNDLARLNLTDVQLPYMTSAIDWTEFHSDNTYILPGKSLLIQCWRASATKSPSHFLFGYGKLFALINDDREIVHFDNVVFFQCPTPFVGSTDDFFQSAWKIIYRSAVKKGWFTESTRFYTTSQQESNYHLCIKESLVDYSVGLSFGTNHRETILPWKKAVAEYVLSRNFTTYNHIAGKEPVSPEKCKDDLRVAVFVRHEGRLGLRLFLNLDEVIHLAATYTTRAVEIIQIGSEHSFMQAVELMNSFDILISPHGSHLTNGVLLLHPTLKPSIIEVVATCYNLDFKKNLDQSFAFYQMSSGHSVPDASLQGDLYACQERADCFSEPGCSFDVVQRAKHTDLLVNISILETDLNEALSHHCKA